MSWINRLVVLASVAVLAGCATSRSEVSISTPQENNIQARTTAAAAPGQKQVYIRSITDQRVFEAAPKDPSIPSLGFGGAANATDDVKARAMGRKRNGYGAALGDVLLPQGQSVTLLVSQQLRSALEDAGYHVVEQATTQPDALVVDVQVKEFWSWIQMGFWSVKLHNKITTELHIENTASPVVVRSAVTQSRQLITDGAWKEIVEQGMADYRKNIQTQWVSKLKK